MFQKKNKLFVFLFALLFVVASVSAHYGGGNDGSSSDSSDSDDSDDRGSGSSCSRPNKNTIYSLNLRSTRVRNNTIDGWFNYAAGTYVANDGTVSISRDKEFLHFDQERFTKTVPLDAFGGNDHPKNLQFYAQAVPVPAKGSLICRAKLSGATFNTARHPYGSAVRDPSADYRLASSSLVTIDFNLGMVADFFITNTKVWVIYERLPFARQAGYNYAAYTFAIPVADRKSSDIHDAYIAFDGTNQAIHWYLDGKKVYTVDHPGSLVNRNFMTLDRCGTEEVVMPKNINCGLGTFTLLDGFPSCPATVPTPVGGKTCTRSSSDKALVQIEPSGYCHPLTGANTPPLFVYDNARGNGKTLFGQGATLKVYDFDIYTETYA